MTMSSPSRVAAMRSPTESEYSDWTRPRRQTNPDVARRPSVLLRQATRRSADVSSSIVNHHHPSSPSVAVPDQRPRTSGSAAHTSSSASSTTVTPSKRNSHRSSLSVSALSNPALAEIPSRKYNALRLSTGSAEGAPLADINSNNNNNNHNGNVQCSPSRDMPPPSDILVPPLRGAANASATSSSPISPHRLNSFYSDRGRSNSEAPSPSSKKALASRTSLGETSPGPLRPATSVHPQDRLVRSYSKQVAPQPMSPEDNHNSPSIDAVLRRDSIPRKVDSSADPVSPARRRGSTPLSPRSSAAKSRMAFSTLDDPYRTAKASDEQTTDDVKDSSTDGSRSRSDDVFLNIAKSSVNDRRNSLGKLDRRRLGLSTRTSFANEQTPSPEQLKYQSSPLFAQDGSPLFASNLSPPASAYPTDESSRTRYLHAGSGSRSVVGVPRSRYNNETSPELPQPYTDVRSTITDVRYRPSNLNNISSRTLRQPSTSDAAERAPPEIEKARTDGTTESSLSTTAPSTVWDELDDLKSRIRKLELTGKFPSSSAAAMSNVSGERPRTAATTATTLSSSPKQMHARKTSVSLEPGATTTSNPIQTLLHSALAKAKTAVGNEVYGVLETTATDALTLANILASTTTSTPSGAVSSVNGSGMTERQAKRKADSLCRSLTELCLALSEEHTVCQPKHQPQSQEHTQSGNQDRPIQTNAIDNSDAVSAVNSRYRRSMSHEPEVFDKQDSASRMSSRLETRRANTINFETSGRRERFSHDEKALPQTPSLNAPLTRLNRLSGSHRLKREEDSDDRSSVFSRTLSSRAMTEVGGYSSSRLSNTRERLSREYANESPSTRLSTSYQQGSSQQPKSSPVQSTIPQRRSYATPPSSGIPTASGANIRPGFRRYGASSTLNTSDRNTSDSPSQMDNSPQSVPQTRITSTSSKMATSYTAIQQPRVRTESLGGRRLGLRLRPSAIGQDNDH